MEHARLIVGLGNPGRDYARTRHNAGFLLVERLAERWQAAWRTDASLQVRTAEADREGRRCWLAQPLTYMNCSGVAVAALLRYYRLSPEQLLVAVDDADLPLGELRLRPQGGSGGHHGLESVAESVGTQTYPRLRLGIGRRPEIGREITGHVLGRFNRDEAAHFDRVLEQAVDAVTCWLSAGISTAMNRFNGAVVAPATKGS
jgi:PTH1 family peptidyl-tRNA hydrolase